MNSSIFHTMALTRFGQLLNTQHNDFQIMIGLVHETHHSQEHLTYGRLGQQLLGLSMILPWGM